MKIGVLALQGSVKEHVEAIKKCGVEPVLVKLPRDLDEINGLIIPGGESTTIGKLMKEYELDKAIKRRHEEGMPIYGTCAGAIMLSKAVGNKMAGQETLGLMDIEVERNSYGRQSESFEADIETVLGPLHAIFIRAPRITKVGKGVQVLAKYDGETIACEQESKKKYYLALSFHPELTTTLFHEHFLKKIVK